LLDHKNNYVGRSNWLLKCQNVFAVLLIMLERSVIILTVQIIFKFVSS